MFPKNLADLMKKHNMSPLALAAALDNRGHPVQVITVQKWLSGENEPRSAALRAIADVFRISLDELYPSPEETRSTM